MAVSDAGAIENCGMLNCAVDVETGALGGEHFAAAIRTLFSADGAGADEFVESTEAAIAECESSMTHAVRARRLELEGELHASLDARDAVGAHTQRLEEVLSTAAATHEAVEARAAVLEERLRVRRNLDAALALVSHTRKLIRTYARIEDVIAGRRLHTALHMLDVVDAGVAHAPDSAALLHQLYPSARRMRNDVATHAKRILHTALAALDAKHNAIGVHALSRIATDETDAWMPRVESEPPYRARSTSDTRGDVDTKSLPPSLYLRPLLQCVQVYGDLGREAELRTGYRSEREKQLTAILANIDSDRSILAVGKATQDVAGFLIAEQTVAVTVGNELCEDAALVKESWRMAHTRLISAIAWLEESDRIMVPLFAAKSMRSVLNSFAEVYALPA